MKIEIVYKSRRNTRKVAEAIGRALKVKPKDISKNTTIDEADILFLGCGIYAGDVHNDVKTFIEKLDSHKVRNIVLFSTCGKGEDQMDKVRDKINECGLNLNDRAYCCKGRAMIFVNRANPDADDLNEAVKFAESIITNN